MVVVTDQFGRYCSVCFLLRMAHRQECNEGVNVERDFATSTLNGRKEEKLNQAEYRIHEKLEENKERDEAKVSRGKEKDGQGERCEYMKGDGKVRQWQGVNQVKTSLFMSHQSPV